MKAQRLAKWLGFKALSLLLLVLTVLLSLLLIQFYQALELKQTFARQSEFQQQTFSTMSVTVEKAIKSQQSLLETLAASPQLSLLLENPEPAAIEDWQSKVTKALPAAERVCLFLTAPTAPSENACLPVTFATLASFRQLQDSPQSDAAMMQPGADSAHVLFMQRLDSGSAKSQASLVMAVKASWLDEVIDDSFVSNGYAQLSQGKKTATSLTGFGNPAFKLGQPQFTAPVAGSVWTLQYWPQATLANTAWMLMAGIAIVIVLAWWLRDRWLGRLVNSDAETLQLQLSDLERQQLKPDYPVLLPALRTVSEQIHDLVLPPKNNANAIQPKQAIKVSPKPSPAVVEEEVLMSSDPEMIVEQALSQAAKEDNNQLDFEPRQAAPEASLPDEAIFRHYDIRGKVGSQLSTDVMQQLGQAVGSEALDQSQTKLVLGRDGRLSSDSLAEAFIKGVLSTGCDVIDIGQVPTPMVYFACEHLETHTGAMITGSHNPIDYNGLKVVIAGKTLLGLGVRRLYDRLKNKQLKQGKGQLSKDNIQQAYIERITGEITLSRSMRIVVDCGNGVAGNIAPELFSALGCEVTELFCDVDGNFPHHHPDPGQPQNMQDLIDTVKAQEAELGLAYDGDGDRLGIVDGQGNIIWPDRLLLLLAQHLLVEKPGSTILYDVKCTSMLEEVISRAGGNPVMTPSGHSVIKSLMQEHDAMLAGEMTGHFFFRDRWYGFDDALYSAARLLELLAADPLERTPTEVFAALPSRVSTPEIIIEMAEGESHRFVEQLQENIEFDGGKVSTVDGVRIDYPKGWGLVRASNTVPGLTLRFEATNQEELEQIKQQFIQQMLKIKPTMSLLF